MLKTLSCALLLLSAISTWGQEKKLLDILPMKDGKVIYTGVVQIDSTDKTKLYNKVKKWFIDEYKSAKDVIQLDDKENGEVIGKGYFQTVWQVTFMSTQNVNVWHTVKVYVKDNKYKYEITDFKLKYYVSPSQYSRGSDVEIALEDFGKDRQKNAKKYFTQIDKEVTHIVSSLESFIRKTSNDDW